MDYFSQVRRTKLGMQSLCIIIKTEKFLDLDIA